MPWCEHPPEERAAHAGGSLRRRARARATSRTAGGDCGWQGGAATRPGSPRRRRSRYDDGAPARVGGAPYVVRGSGRGVVLAACDADHVLARHDLDALTTTCLSEGTLVGV